jgi:lysophospholipase L1-like esterase
MGLVARSPRREFASAQRRRAGAFGWGVAAVLTLSGCSGAIGSSPQNNGAGGSSADGGPVNGVGGGDIGSGGSHAGAGGGAGAQSNGGSGNGGKGGSSSGNGGSSAGSGGSPSGNGGSPDGGITAGPPAVRFVGRFDKAPAAGPKFAWSGSGIIARFSGTQVGINLGGGQQYTALVDGVLKPKLIPGGGTSSIATGLSAGPHLVEIYRRTEANQGDAQFLGFDFGAGTLLSPPPTPDRRLEVIGDSITCGYGDEGADMNCSFTADTENHYLSYEAITARTLGADLITTAWSGKGVVCNYGDDPTSCTHPFPEYYDKTLPDQGNSPWDFSSWQPQAVVINLGTNDFSTSQDPSEAEFTTAYESFLQHIRSKYADALILCTVGPLLGGTDLATAKDYIAKAVLALGDAKVKTFDLAQTDPADGYGCDWHPSLKTHQKMADQLTAELKAQLGW